MENTQEQTPQTTQNSQPPSKQDYLKKVGLTAKERNLDREQAKQLLQKASQKYDAQFGGQQEITPEKKSPIQNGGLEEPKESTGGSTSLPNDTSNGASQPITNNTPTPPQVSPELQAADAQINALGSIDANGQFVPAQEGVTEGDYRRAVQERKDLERTLSKVPQEEKSLWNDVKNSVSRGTKQALAGLAGTPQFLNKTMFSIIAPDSAVEYANSLPEDQKEAFIANLTTVMGAAGGQPLALGTGTIGVQGNKAQKALNKEAEAFGKKMTQYDKSITSDLGNGDYGQAFRRILVEGAGSAPSILQAMIPYVGLTSVAAGTAANKQEQLEDEGEGTNLKTVANSAITGTAEAIFEKFTAKQGNKVIKALLGKDKTVVKSAMSGLMSGLKGALGEGASEAATTATEQLADYIILGKEKEAQQVFEELADSFLIGAAVGGKMKAAQAGAGQLNSIFQQASNNRKNEQAQVQESEVSESSPDNTTDNVQEQSDVGASNGDVSNGTIRDTGLSEPSSNEELSQPELTQQVETKESTSPQLERLKQNIEAINVLTKQLKKITDDATKKDIKTQIDGLNRFNDNIKEEIKSKENETSFDKIDRAESKIKQLKEKLKQNPHNKNIIQNQLKSEKSKMQQIELELYKDQPIEVLQKVRENQTEAKAIEKQIESTDDVSVKADLTKRLDAVKQANKQLLTGKEVQVDITELAPETQSNEVDVSDKIEENNTVVEDIKKQLEYESDEAIRNDLTERLDKAESYGKRLQEQEAKQYEGKPTEVVEKVKQNKAEIKEIKKQASSTSDTSIKRDLNERISSLENVNKQLLAGEEVQSNLPETQPQESPQEATQQESLEQKITENDATIKDIKQQLQYEKDEAIVSDLTDRLQMAESYGQRLSEQQQVAQQKVAETGGSNATATQRNAVESVSDTVESAQVNQQATPEATVSNMTKTTTDATVNKPVDVSASKVAPNSKNDGGGNTPTKVVATQKGGASKKRQIVNRLESDSNLDQDLVKKLKKEGLDKYEPQTEKERNRIIESSIKQAEVDNNGDTGKALTQVSNELRSGKYSDFFTGKLASTLVSRLTKNGNFDEAYKVISYATKESTRLGQGLAGFKSDGTADSFVAQHIRNISEGKMTILDSKVDGDTTLRQEMSEMKAELEAAYKKLQQTQKKLVAERKKKDTGKAETKAERKKKAKQLRNEGMEVIKDFLEGKLTSQAVNDNPISNSQVFDAVKKVFEGLLIEAGGNVDAAFSNLKAQISKTSNGKITEQHLDDYQVSIMAESNPQIVKDFEQEVRKIIKKYQDRENARVGEKKQTKKQKSTEERIVSEIVGMNSPQALQEMSVDKFADLFAEQYGYKSIPLETMNELVDLSERLQKAELEGKKALFTDYHSKINRLLSKQRKKDPEYYRDLLLDLTYANALSGINTYSFNAPVGMIATSALEYMNTLIYNPIASAAATYNTLFDKGTWKSAFKDAWGAFKTGDSRFDASGSYQDKKSGILQNKIVNGLNDAMANMKNEPKLHKKMMKAFPVVGNAMLKAYHLSFILPAQDAFATHFISEYMQNYNAMIDSNVGSLIKNNNTRESLKEVNNKLGNDKETRARLKKQVEQEINELKAEDPKLVPYNYENIRLKELIQDQRGEEAVANAIKTAKNWNLIGSPTGALGAAYSSVNKVLSKTPQTKSQAALNFLMNANLLFMRIMATSINASFRNIPVAGLVDLGYSKVMGGRLVRNDSGEYVREKLTNRLIAQRIMQNATVTGISALAFASMFDIDEDEDGNMIIKLDDDRLIDITGGGSGSFAEDEQKGIKPYRIRFRSSSNDDFSEGLPYTYIPHLTAAFAVLGGAADDINLKGKKGINVSNPSSGTSTSVMNDMIGAYTNMSFAGTFRDISAVMYASRGSEQDEEGNDIEKGGYAVLKEAAKRFGLKPAQGLVKPNFARDMWKMFQSTTDGKIKDPDKFHETLVNGIPVIDAMINKDKTDWFGNPIEIESPLDIGWIKAFDTDYISKHKEGKKEYNVMGRFPNVKPLKPYRIPKQIAGMKVPPKLKDEIQLIQKLALRDMIREKDRYNKLMRLKTVDELNRVLQVYRRVSINKAKKKAVDMILEYNKKSKKK